MSDKVWKYLSARIGSQWYGIEVDKVIEVLHLVAFTEIHAHQNDVLGLITVRDIVMPLIDLRRRFGLYDAPLKLDTPVVAIRDSNGAVALLFDDTDRVDDIAESQVTAYEDSHQFPYIRGVAKLPGRLLLLLDTSRISREIQSPPEKVR
jgi:purine-binding chemotaxis protein CheW